MSQCTDDKRAERNEIDAVLRFPRGHSTEKYAGPAWRLKIGSHLLMGGGVVVMTSSTYSTPIAPLPLMTACWRRASMNATWIPPLTRGESGAVAGFATIQP